MFWSAVFLVFYVYAGYLAVLLLTAVFCREKRREPGYYPTISVVIASYNEAAVISRKLSATLSLNYPADRFEVIVSSDASTDGTDEIVTACADPRVRLHRVDMRSGKTHAQNEAVNICKGEIIVFSDATTTYDKNALAYLACNFQDPSVGAVSGRYDYYDPEGMSPTGTGSIAFWKYENLLKRLQSRIYTLTGCSGCIYAVRRSLYTPLGDALCSDLVQPLHIVRQGFRVIFEPRALAHEITTKSAGDEFRMRVRVTAHGMVGVFSVPELFRVRNLWIAYQLVSHKLLRWAVPAALITCLISSAALTGSVGYRIVFCLQVAFYAFGFLTLRIPLYRYWRLLGVPLYFCTVHSAPIASLLQLWRGNRYSVWETVRK
jgi:cellulose synthase/poly-beta-1,6-N-acetylglucosamine synthase-like glycosyltransferase